MKKLLLLLISILPLAQIYAQKVVPQIKVNTVITYNLTQEGLEAPLTFTITDMGSPIKIDWSIDGYGTGNITMPTAALEKGKTVVVASPVPDQLTALSSIQTVACISKSAFNSLITNKGFEYDNLKFSLSPDNTAFTVNGQVLDVIHVVATNGKGEVWILNNPDFPLICRTKDYAQGADIDLTSIK